MILYTLELLIYIPNMHGIHFSLCCFSFVVDFKEVVTACEKVLESAHLCPHIYVHACIYIRGNNHHIDTLTIACIQLCLEVFHQLGLGK